MVAQQNGHSAATSRVIDCECTVTLAASGWSSNFHSDGIIGSFIAFSLQIPLSCAFFAGSAYRIYIYVAWSHLSYRLEIKYPVGPGLLAVRFISAPLTPS